MGSKWRGTDKSASFQIELLENRRLFAFGTDPYFGSGGVAAIPFLGADPATAVVTTPDGHIYVAANANGIFGLARLTFNGQLDPSFGGTGYITNADGPYTQHDVTSVAVQSDGKVLIGGDTPFHFATFRYNTDGTLDTTFGVAGLATTAFTYDDFLSKLVIQPDGKILAVGTSYNGNHDMAAMARYNADGSPDTSFGTGGSVLADFGPTLGLGASTSSELLSAAVLPTGKILLAGDVGSQVLLGRYTANGTLDPQFGAGGLIHTSAIAGKQFNAAEAMTLAPGGGFYTELVSNFGTKQVGVVKWTAAGQVDSHWGASGYITAGSITTISSGDIAVQADGSVVVFEQAGLVNQFSLEVIDSTGNQALYSVVRSAGSRLGTSGIALQPDGRTVVAPGFNLNGNPPIYGAPVFRYFTMADRHQGVWLEGSVLTVLGESTSNTVDVEADGSNYDITLDGVTTSLPMSLVSHIDVRLLGSGNTVTTGSGVPMNVVDMGSGTGNAATIAGSALYLVQAGGGDDTVTLPTPADGQGASTVVAAASDALLLTGTDDADLFSVTPTTIQSPGRSIALQGMPQVSITTGEGNDLVYLNAAAGPSVIVHGGDGDDLYVVTGGGPVAHPDMIYSGRGSNTLWFTTAPSAALQLVNDPAGIVSIEYVSNVILAQFLTMSAGGIIASYGDTLLISNPAAVSQMELGDVGNTAVHLDYSAGDPLPGVLRLHGYFSLFGLQGADPLAGKLLDIEQSDVYFVFNQGAEPLDAIRSYLHNGYALGAWTGVPTASAGVITSGALASDSTKTVGIGYVDSGSIVHLGITLYGDTGLQRTVGFTDFMRLTQHFTLTGQYWASGDFNYDGTVDFADFNLLAANYGKVGVPITPITTPLQPPTPPMTASVVNSDNGQSAPLHRGHLMAPSTKPSSPKQPGKHRGKR